MVATPAHERHCLQLLSEMCWQHDYRLKLCQETTWLKSGGIVPAAASQMTSQLTLPEGRLIVQALLGLGSIVILGTAL